MPITWIEGMFTPLPDLRFGIVVSRYNHLVTDRLLEGALDALRRHGIPDDAIVVVRVPGSFELPWAVQRLAQSGRFDAVIALGAVIRGATPHFDHVASSAAGGCAQAMALTGVPVVFGVLTTDTLEQAIERAGTKMGNKGWEAALVAIEMVQLRRALEQAGY
ncbi:MAG: 6,7-dimethyl-8-ribityllumazine synthase [Sandaracinaceae bacterium]|nr:6,7-dimethyl-8-ribityllumazine synthase [Sandaracinaceae bacterium]MDW8247146.1 6,7-dimethyl-8-ribityllumazine synthase [Sandaracinaceae bacterium]